jgi:[protein-PII] uridylyltransferase
MRYLRHEGRNYFIRAKEEERQQRLERFGYSVCLQEPHLKEGIGALRDLHHGLWLSYLLFQVQDFEGLQARRVLGPREARIVKDAVDYILLLRHGLHYLCGKREDHLTFARQEGLAKSLGYEDHGDELAEGAMLRRYYSCAISLKRFADSMTRRADAQLKKRSILAFARKLSDRTPEIEPPFMVRNKEIDFRSYQPRPENLREYFSKDKNRILRLVEFLHDHDLQWATPVCLALEASADLIDSEFIGTQDVREFLLRIFRGPQPLASTLYALRDTGLLPCFFPELSRIQLLVRHDLYHRFTVDEHTIRAVEELDRLGRIKTRASLSEVFSEEMLALLWGQSPKPELLRLATLFHDAGKGHGRGHSERGARMAARALQRLELSRQDVEMVEFLIENHLIMSTTAFRRDIDNYKTVADFTRKAGTLQRLENLLLLTYADISSTSPGVMTPWKSGLLWQLYLRSRQLILGEPTILAPDLEESRQKIFSLLSPRFDREVVEKHLTQLPAQYTLSTSPGLIGRHLATLDRFDGKAVQTHVRFLEFHEMEGSDHKERRQETLEVIVVTSDRLGLFRDIARAFHLENFHIVSARLFTRKDGAVVDTIMAVNALPETPVGKDRIHVLSERLRRVVAPGTPSAVYEIRPLKDIRSLAEVDLARTSFRTQVELIDEPAEDTIIIEVQALVRPGLLETLAACLTARGLNIRFARLQSQGGRAIHTFHVTGPDGSKPDIGQLESDLREFILQHLDPSSAEEARSS